MLELRLPSMPWEIYLLITTLMLFYWLMPVMPSTRLIVNVLSITFQFYVHLLLPSWRIPMGCLLFITGEGEIASTEGATQGDPLAMAMYALAVTLLICSIWLSQPDASQVWYDDDATAGGKLVPLLHWWKHLLTYGPVYGFFPNASKTCLIVKPVLLKNYLMVLIYRYFVRVNVTWVLLSEPDPLQKAMFLRKWRCGLRRFFLTLSSIAETHSHSAYSATTWRSYSPTLPSYINRLNAQFWGGNRPAFASLLIRWIEHSQADMLQWFSSKLLSASLVAMIIQQTKDFPLSSTGSFYHLLV